MIRHVGVRPWSIVLGAIVLARAALAQHEAGGSNPATIAPPAVIDTDTLVFSTKSATPKPLLSPADFAIAQALRELIEQESYKHIRREHDRAGVTAFYRARDFAPLWFEKGAPSQRAIEAIDVLKAAAADGLEPDDYPTPRFADTGAYRAAADELLLTSSVLNFVRHASMGRVHFTRVSGSIHFDLKAADPRQVLTTLAEADDVRRMLASYFPQHPEYQALKAALAAARNEDEAPSLRIPSGSMLRPGTEDDRVPLLRQRLGLAAANDALYDDALVQAVRRFQQANGLKPDGVIGPGTLAALNGATGGGRVETIVANMERWRWLPHDLGSAHVMVNIPDYSLEVVENGKVIWRTRIVVGTPGQYATPLLAEPMKYITVNPTWNVPPSIIRNEYLPALQRDPDALARIGLRIGRNSDGSLRIYQPPGGRNALGRLRFNFPNRFLVYQHDTPDKHLFERSERAYSHGCMRVQDPERYAEVLLALSQPHEGYTAQRIQAMYGDRENIIHLQRPIPVYVTYRTVIADAAGNLQVRPDIYGHDRTIASIMRNERDVADVPIERDYHSASRPVMATVPRRQEPRDPLNAFGTPFGRGSDDGGAFGFFDGEARRRSRHSIW
jgi:murein L,D-transpeptidase YcbB/YkuD